MENVKKQNKITELNKKIDKIISKMNDFESSGSSLQFGDFTTQGKSLRECRETISRLITDRKVMNYLKECRMQINERTAHLLGVG